jgi:hypothetical protein
VKTPRTAISVTVLQGDDKIVRISDQPLRNHIGALVSVKKT